MTQDKDNQHSGNVDIDGKTGRVANPFALPSNDLVPSAGASGIVKVEQERAIAEVQAMLTIAKANPRDHIRAADLVLTDCTYIDLAAHATYDYIRGGSSITGPTIRLAEAIARRWGNIECGVRELSRYGGVSDCMAYAWDLETTYREVRTFQVVHQRDRSERKGGSYELTDQRDIYELIANVGARRKRACIQAIIPGSLFTSAMNQCEVTLKNNIDIGPVTISEVIDRFAPYGVTAPIIEKRIQRRFHESTVTPGIIIMLRKIYNSLQDGMSVPGDWFDMPAAGEQQETQDTTAHGRRRAKPKAEDKKDPPPAAKPQGAAGEPPAGDPPVVEDHRGDDDATLGDVDQTFILRKLDVAALGATDLEKAFNVDHIRKLKVSQMPAILRWIADPTVAPQ